MKQSFHKSSASAFTLMELLVVMAIMVLVTSVFVASYFGMSRSSGYRSSEDVVFNNLQLAHQRACMLGRSVYFYFIDDASFVMVHSAGTVSSITGKIIYDEFSDEIKFADSATEKKEHAFRIWNLTNPGSRPKPWEVLKAGLETAIVTPYPDDNSLKIERKQLRLELVSTGIAGYWRVGDTYGIEVRPVQYLPGGFKFIQAPTAIVFEANGGCSFVGGSGSFSIIESALGGNAGNRKIDFTISENGKIRSSHN